MGKLEQIPVTGESTEKTEKQEEKLIKKAGKVDEIADGNIINSSKETEWKDSVETDKELSEEDAEKEANEITENPEAINQINKLNQIWEKYRNWELKDVQKKQYENLMGTIKTELDRDIPRVIEMNKEINDYYNTHPEDAEKEANKIAKNPGAKEDVLLVNEVVKGRNYLKKESQNKLDTVINMETSKLDEEAKSVLGMDMETI